MPNIDDFIHQVEVDERHDRAEVAKKLTPIEYGRLRGIVPQKVYHHLRKHRGHQECDHHLALEDCVCGRKVLDVETADRYFDLGPEKYDVEVEMDEDADPEELDEEEEDTGEDPDGIDSMDEQYDKNAGYGTVYENDLGDTERYDSPWR